MLRRPTGGMLYLIETLMDLNVIADTNGCRELKVYAVKRDRQQLAVVARRCVDRAAGGRCRGRANPAAGRCAVLA